MKITCPSLSHDLLNMYRNINYWYIKNEHVLTWDICSKQKSPQKKIDFKSNKWLKLKNTAGLPAHYHDATVSLFQITLNEK